MASWIRVRTGLPHDNRVCLIAAELDVPVAQIVGAFVILWVKAYEQGDHDEQYEDDIVMWGTKEQVDLWAGVKGFYDAAKAYDWIQVHETQKGKIVVRNLVQHIPDGRTAKDRNATYEGRKERKAGKRREKIQTEQAKTWTPEFIALKKGQGITNEQMWSFGWLPKGVTAEEFIRNAGAVSGGKA